MFADRMERVPFSGIREIFEAAAAQEAAGVDVVSLLIGRPDFDTPEPIKEAAIEAIHDGKVHYTSNYGIEPLRDGIAAKLSADCGLDYDPDSELVVTTGVTEAVVSTVFSFAGPGDEVLVPDPAWTYPASVAMAGAEAVPYRMASEDGFQPDVDHLREQVGEDTTLLVVNSPHNPTGGVLSERRARELRDFAVEHDLVVLSDEIYEQIVFGDAEHHSLATFDGMRERTVTTNGFSKAYSMTGWRLGYMAAPEELVDALVRVRQYTTTCAPSISQWAGVRALEGDLQDPLVEAFEERAARTHERIQRVPGMSAPEPRGAFYAFPTVPDGYDDGTEFAYDLLEATGVAVVPGDAFGDQPDRVRIAYSNSVERIDEAFDRIEAFVGA